MDWMDWMDGWILLRTLVQLEHLAVLKIFFYTSTEILEQKKYIFV